MARAFMSSIKSEFGRPIVAAFNIADVGGSFSYRLGNETQSYALHPADIAQRLSKTISVILYCMQDVGALFQFHPETDILTLRRSLPLRRARSWAAFSQPHRSGRVCR